MANKISGVDLEGKVVVVRKKYFAASYQEGDRRFLCTGGFGCDPALSGTSIFGTWFCDGNNDRIRRGDVEELADDQTARPAVS